VDLDERLDPDEHIEVTLTFFIPASVEGEPNLALTLNSPRSPS
jgi:hypothetical protein